MFESVLAERGLSLDRLKNFCAIAEAGGIARTAGGDPAKQSLYSRQVRELEQFFGTELTRRKGKGIELTEQGLELARQARAHLTSLADFKKNCAGQAVQFRVASGNSVIEWLLIPNLGKITASLSSAHLSLRDMRTEEAIRGLRDHTLDFGILRKSAVVAPLRFHSTGYVSYSLFAPSTWVDKKRSIESLFARHPVAVSIGDEFSQRFHEACAKAKLEPNIRFTCASLTQAAELVRTRQAVALLPDMAESNLGNAVTRLDFPPLRTYRREIGIVWHPRLVSIRPQAESVLAVLKGIRMNS